MIEPVLGRVLFRRQYRVLCAEKNATKIYAHKPAPLLQCLLVRRGADANASIVRQHIQAPELRDCLLDDGFPVPLRWRHRGAGRELFRPRLSSPATAPPIGLADSASVRGGPSSEN
jgi:hypothetical protein